MPLQAAQPRYRSQRRRLGRATADGDVDVCLVSSISPALSLPTQHYLDDSASPLSRDHDAMRCGTIRYDHPTLTTSTSILPLQRPSDHALPPYLEQDRACPPSSPPLPPIPRSAVGMASTADDTTPGSPIDTRPTALREAVSARRDEASSLHT
ncbi:hypothetical protein PMIN03_008591 [Paraphaeosphaeria minitans]